MVSELTTQLPPAEAGGLITGTRPSKGYSPEGGEFKPPLIDILRM